MPILQFQRVKVYIATSEVVSQSFDQKKAADVEDVETTFSTGESIYCDIRFNDDLSKCRNHVLNG